MERNAKRNASVKMRQTVTMWTAVAHAQENGREFIAMKVIARISIILTVSRLTCFSLHDISACIHELQSPKIRKSRKNLTACNKQAVTKLCSHSSLVSDALMFCGSAWRARSR